MALGVGRPVAASGYSHWRAVLAGQAACLSHHVCSKYVTEFMKRSTLVQILVEFHYIVSLPANKPLGIGSAKQIIFSSCRDYR